MKARNHARRKRMVGGIGVAFVAYGIQWSSLGNGLDAGGSVTALTVFDDTTGPALYAGGGFATVENYIAKWDSTQWLPLGSGMNSFVQALTVFDDGSGSGPALYAGGNFVQAYDSGDAYLAKWGCSASSITTVQGCFGNPTTLAAQVSSASIGLPLPVQMQGSAFSARLVLLFAGLESTDAVGCGFLLPGTGELLMAPTPAPLVLAQQPTTGGSADFLLTIPSNPGLVGMTVLLQAFHIGVLPAPPIEVSTGLSVTFVP